MNLKVLPNDYQKWLSLPCMTVDKIFGDVKLIPAQFNRVGFYMLDRKTAWYEFKLPDGTFFGVVERVEAFQGQLEMLEAEEHPYSDEAWEKLLWLLKRKVIKWDKKLRDEEWRRERVDLSRSLARPAKRMHVRIRDRLKEKKALKEGQD